MAANGKTLNKKQENATNRKKGERGGGEGKAGNHKAKAKHEARTLAAADFLTVANSCIMLL